MRVLVLSNMWPDTAGLFGTFVADQVADLERSGLETSVLSFDARRELGLDPSRPLVLFPGARENAVKRYELFRATLDRVDAGELVFQGYDRERAVLALNAADAVLMTSRHEGSPVTIREALACET